MKKTPILIIGSIALDTIETPKGNRSNLLGGSATYAMIAAKNKASVHISAVVGKDFPKQGHSVYEQYSDDLTDFITEDGPTFRWGGRYHENMDQRDTLFTELGVFQNFNPRLSKLNRRVPYVFLANIHPQLQLSVIQQMENNPTVIVDTMNLWIETTKNDLLQVLKRTDILLINDSESELLTGDTDLQSSAEKIQAIGPKIVIIKRGSKGAAIFDGKDTFSVGVYPVSEIVDTTGAGDTFGGGFVASLAKGESLSDAVIYGSALASICVEGFGVERILKACDKDVEIRTEYLHQTG